MNKKDLAKELSRRTLITQKEAVQVVNELFDIILEEVSEDKEISIVGFGKFYSYEHAARPVRNPKTQEQMVLDPYKSLRFKTSNIAKKLLKSKSYNGDL
jgi:nucleoid DNA-binding protein